MNKPQAFLGLAPHFHPAAGVRLFYYFFYNKNKYINFHYFIFFILCLFSAAGYSQSKNLSLQQVLDIAGKSSPRAKLAETTRKTRYWNYRNFKSNYLPQLRLEGNLPGLQRGYQRITLNDGTDAFRLRTLANSNLGLTLNQGIALTGGQVFLSSNLQRIDLLGSQRNISYMSSPASIGISQPVFGFNRLRWDRKIEPLRYEESRKQYNEDLEQARVDAAGLFFNLLLAQINYRIQEKNLMNNDTLYKISRGRYNLGKIAENDLLQMELSVMNARANLNQAQLDVEQGSLALRTFLNLRGNELIVVEEPPIPADIPVNEELALREALNNRQQITAMKRQLMEARAGESEAQRSRFGFDLVGQYGFTQTSTDLSSAYRNPLEQQSVSLGVSVPIADWGRSQSRIEIAKANRELAELNNEVAEQNFRQDIILAVKQVNMSRRKVMIAAKADTIAQRRYDITVQRYLIGKISIVDLNIANQEKDQARQDYIASLRNYWNSWLELRRKTLYDFENGKTIRYEAGLTGQ
jgi:outer membrane protein TolC